MSTNSNDAKWGTDVPSDGEVSEPETTEEPRQRREMRRVNVDPRTVGFTFGKNREMLKNAAADILESTGAKVFMDYVQAPNNSFGSTKKSSTLNIPG